VDATAPAVVAAFPDLNTDEAAKRFTTRASRPRHNRRHAGKLARSFTARGAQNAIASNWLTAEQVLGLS